MSRYDKIKPSRHFEKNSDRPGHDVPLEDVTKVIEQPEDEEVQEDLRVRYWSFLEAYPSPVRAVVSACASGRSKIGRVVTAFIDRGKGKPK